jgi:hypothetical protein
MNHTMIAIIIVISTLVIVGPNVAPLLQKEAYASLKHPFKTGSFKSQLLNQLCMIYRSPYSSCQNVAMQNLGKGNSATGWGDQSSNLQQNQTTQPQQLQPNG